MKHHFQFIYSPINIVTESAVPSSFATPISVELAENVSVTITYKNDGHGITAKVVFEGGMLPNITGGPLGIDTYTFFNFHIHWPSEHAIDGIFYPAELHIVHFNLKYGSLEAAISKPDGIAVVGVFFEVSSRNFSRINYS